MGFSDTQLSALDRRVPPTRIRSRTVQGRELHYIEGWYALSQANRIFGPDGWDRETVETKCALARYDRGHHAVVYTARVRITEKRMTAPSRPPKPMPPSVPLPRSARPLVLRCMPDDEGRVCFT